MKHVIIDLEMNPVYADIRLEMNSACFSKSFSEKDCKGKGSVAEIIEIGAVMLDECGKTEKEFHSYVKPEFDRIHRKITKLTGITNEQVAQACNFHVVMTQFLAWLGTEEIHVYSWSSSDLIQIQRECCFKGYEAGAMEALYSNWTDLQKEFSNILGISMQLSLQRAISSANLNFSGKKHNAIDDARNTAELYKMMQNKQNFVKYMGPIIDLFQPHQEGCLFADLCPELMNMAWA